MDMGIQAEFSTILEVKGKGPVGLNTLLIYQVVVWLVS